MAGFQGRETTPKHRSGPFAKLQVGAHSILFLYEGDDDIQEATELQTDDIRPAKSRGVESGGGLPCKIRSKVIEGYNRKHKLMAELRWLGISRA